MLLVKPLLPNLRCVHESVLQAAIFEDCSTSTHTGRSRAAPEIGAPGGATGLSAKVGDFTVEEVTSS
jgi:hypothetical protein